jgi:hypothetical protein
MNHNLANGMKMWKGNGNNTTLLFSMKGLNILHQERRGQVNTIVTVHLNGILLHKSKPANKQHTNHSFEMIRGHSLTMVCKSPEGGGLENLYILLLWGGGQTHSYVIFSKSIFCIINRAVKGSYFICVWQVKKY